MSLALALHFGCKLTENRQFSAANMKLRIDMSNSDKTSLTYADAGVSINKGDALIERIKPLAKATRRIGAAAALGGFGGAFDLKACGYDDPILISGCLLYTSPSPRDQRGSRMPSSA